MRKAVFLIFLTLFLFNAQGSFANTPLLTATGSSGIASADKPVNYQLPYPGILPDNPLYFFKVLRDKIVGFFISDPLKKTDFDLLQADKRLNAAVYLFKEGETKYSLAESTISKGENYFQDALNKVSRAKKQGEDTKDILARLYLSSIEHQQVIGNLERKTNGNVKERLLTDMRRAQDFQKKVKLLMPK